MTFSPLTARTVPTKNYSRRTGPVSRLIIHHTAGGTNDSNVRLLSDSFRVAGRKVSCTYVLQTTGALVGIVPEQYRPWTSGSAIADGPAITVETVNSTRGPRWEVTDAQLEKLAQLAADLSIRYSWGPLNRRRVMGHREWYSTSCPGPYLYPRLDAIVARANTIRRHRLAGQTPTPPPTPTPTPGPPTTGVNDQKEPLMSEAAIKNINNKLDYHQAQGRDIATKVVAGNARIQAQITDLAFKVLGRLDRVEGGMTELTEQLVQAIEDAEDDGDITADVSATLVESIREALERVTITLTTEDAEVTR